VRSAAASAPRGQHARLGEATLVRQLLEQGVQAPGGHDVVVRLRGGARGREGGGLAGGAVPDLELELGRPGERLGHDGRPVDRARLGHDLARRVQGRLVVPGLVVGLDPIQACADRVDALACLRVPRRSSSSTCRPRCGPPRPARGRPTRSGVRGTATTARSGTRWSRCSGSTRQHRRGRPRHGEGADADPPLDQALRDLARLVPSLEHTRATAATASRSRRRVTGVTRGGAHAGRQVGDRPSDARGTAGAHGPGMRRAGLITLLLLSIAVVVVFRSRDASPQTCTYCDELTPGESPGPAVEGRHGRLRVRRNGALHRALRAPGRRGRVRGERRGRRRGDVGPGG
jgi:hypothetical protein